MEFALELRNGWCRDALGRVWFLAVLGGPGVGWGGGREVMEFGGRAYEWWFSRQCRIRAKEDRRPFGFLNPTVDQRENHVEVSLVHFRVRRGSTFEITFDA